jgi:hypothetical protein
VSKLAVKYLAAYATNNYRKLKSETRATALQLTNVLSYNQNGSSTVSLSNQLLALMSKAWDDCAKVEPEKFNMYNPAKALLRIKELVPYGFDLTNFCEGTHCSSFNLALDSTLTEQFGKHTTSTNTKAKYIREIVNDFALKQEIKPFTQMDVGIIANRNALTNANYSSMVNLEYPSGAFIELVQDNLYTSPLDYTTYDVVFYRNNQCFDVRFNANNFYAYLSITAYVRSEDNPRRLEAQLLKPNINTLKELPKALVEAWNYIGEK